MVLVPVQEFSVRGHESSHNERFVAFVDAYLPCMSVYKIFQMLMESNDKGGIILGYLIAILGLVIVIFSRKFSEKSIKDQTSMLPLSFSDFDMSLNLFVVRLVGAGLVVFGLLIIVQLL